MKKIIISKSDNGIRLDKFLFKVMNAPQGEVYRSLRKKKIKVSGKRTTDGTKRLCGGDVIELYVNDELLNLDFFKENKKSKNTESKLDIVYEDENIIVLNKPSGMLSQSDSGESLEKNMREYLNCGLGAYTPSLCHRIDRNTKGLLIGAKNITAHRIIAEKIKTKEIRKFYLCEICGHLLNNSGTINGYITKEKDNKVRFTKEVVSIDSKPSELTYKVLNTKKDKSTVRVELKSGRTHQIRASFAYMGCPLVGDVKYGAPHDGKHDFQSLVAYKIVFDFKNPSGELDYLNGKEIEIEV